MNFFKIEDMLLFLEMTRADLSSSNPSSNKLDCSFITPTMIGEHFENFLFSSSRHDSALGRINDNNVGELLKATDGQPVLFWNLRSETQDNCYCASHASF
jgi:hypothetical protein